MVVDEMKTSVDGDGECDHAISESVRVIEADRNMTHSRMTERDNRGGKLSRLHHNRSSKSVQRIDFKFTHLKALQVPKGWDKLFISVITENGKTLAKSSKVPVRNGGCHWADTISESLWVSKNSTSKEIEDCPLKLLVATGSPRSGILGEATVSVTSYMSSSAAVPLSIPLNKCNHGTVLHVTVQCLLPSEKIRIQESRNSQIKALNADRDNHDVAVESNGSNQSYVPSVESPSTKDFDSSPFEVCRGISLSGPGSQCSHISAEGFIGSGNIFDNIYLRDNRQSPTREQDSINSQKKSSHCNYPFYDSSQSNTSFMGSGNFSSMQLQEFSASSSSITNSSKIRLEPVDDTIQELRAEAKMWEMNARKLMVDLDMLRTEFSEQSKNLANLRTELSKSHVERDSLKKEVEQLKQSLEEPMVKQKALEDSLSQGECVPEVEKALKDELKFQKESYANLSLQLKRSQEANIELISILQELEETIKQQKNEIEKLSASNFSDLQTEQPEESKKNLMPKGQQQEGVLENTTHDIENANSTSEKILLDIKTEYESKLSAKEEEILSFKAKLTESLEERSNVETVSRLGGDADLMREIEVLREKVQELEMDCNELTDENLELLFKLKQGKNNSRKGACEDFPPNKLKDQYFAIFGSEVSDNAFQVLHLEDLPEGKVARKNKDSDHISVQELQSLKQALEIRITELSKDVTDKISEMAILEANLLSKEQEIAFLQNRQSELEAKVSQFQNEKIQLEEHMEVMLKERDINTKCLYNLQNDLGSLSRSMDSHVSANEILRRKSLELENKKHELELHVSDVEQEKEQLSMRISVLEVQLRNLTNERDSSLSELQNSRSHASRLQEEIMKIKSEMDSSVEDLKEKLKVIQCKWSEAQQECEYLRGANQQSQTAIENLAEECNSLQKSNGELRKLKLELQELCSVIGTRLTESDKRIENCSEKVELLERKFTLMLEDNASKEKSLTSELDVLLDENIRNIEQAQSLLNQILMEKTAEIQNLQKKLEHISVELSATYHEKERIASNATVEISALCADKAKLESAFEEVQSEVISTKKEINIMQKDYEQKLQDLKSELTAFRSNREMLMADYEKLLKQVEDHKSGELKLKSTMKALDLKLSVSEFEKQQLTEETENLKIQLQQIERFENEIMALRNELTSTNSEKEKLEASLSVTSELCEDLKAEKIVTLESAVSELEDCRKSRVSLEERLAQVESDLQANEILLAQEAEQKNEISRIKRINRHNQYTIRLLEQKKNEFQTKAQALEEELKLTKEQTRNQVSVINRKALPVHEDLKNPIMRSTSQIHGIRKKPFLKNDREAVRDQHDISSSKHQSEAETEYGLLNENVHAVEADQLNRFLSEGQHYQAAPMKSSAEGEVVSKERFERTKSILEAELRDIQERYSHMSLKFAEVEAEREELVMKLRVAKNQKEM